jgi:gas vesicle protein
MTPPQRDAAENNWFALGAFCGATVGLVLGLLTAPRPGAETRRALADQSAGLRQRWAERVEDAPGLPGGGT